MVNDTNIYEEISSSVEETTLNEQFSELLLKLEKDLERLKVESDEDLGDHFKQLEGLKKTANLSVINIKDVTGFLETDIFALMVELPEAFSFKPLTIYKCMLKHVESFPKSVYQEHLQVLLDLKNDETKDLLLLINDEKKEKKQQNSLLLEKESEWQTSVIRPFFSILSATKAKKRALSENDIVSPKRGKLLRVSPLALQNNSLSNQIDDECHENLLRPGMKLT
ncbi:MAG: hypothetical protein WA659_04955 [Candidatus Aquirickettsiella sp.]